MNSFEKILELVSKNCFMASIDLTDAYFVAEIPTSYRKYLRFYWDGKLYQFCCLPFGLSPAPRIFTKIMKPPMSLLRQMGHESADYIDNIWLTGRTEIYSE